MKQPKGQPKVDPTFLLQQWEWANDPLGVLKWAIAFQLKNEEGKPLEWRDRRFLIDILCDMHPLQVTKKCSQVGETTTKLFKAYFMAMVMGRRIIYSLPTEELVEDLSTTKLEPMEKENPRVVPTATNNKGSKSWDKAGYILIRGTKGKSQDVMVTADYVIADEVNHSDVNVIKGLESRLSASAIAAQWWFGHPTVPMFGVDEKWLLSDQREWHVKCKACNDEQPLDYWQNVDKERRIYVCRTCRAPLSDEDRRMGRWIPTVTDIDGHPPKWHGYHISHLMAPWISADKVIDSEATNTKEHFFSKVLGIPTTGGGNTVDTTLIMRAVLEPDDPRRKVTPAQKFMGVDVGAKLHVVIGSEHGITKVMSLAHDKDILPEDRDNLDSEKSKWGKLVKIMTTEGITLCVIDNGPQEQQVNFQKRFPYKVLRCIYDYKDKRKEDWEKNAEEGTIHAHRTRIIDATVKSYSVGETLVFLDKDDPLLNGTGKQSFEECLTRHWSTLFEIGGDGADINIVKKDRMGNVIRTWANSGPDHLAHGNVYYFLARAAGRYLGTGTGGFMPGGASAAKSQRKAAPDEDDLDDEPKVTFFGNT